MDNQKGPVSPLCTSLSREKLAVAIAIIKLKPVILSGEKYAQILAQRFLCRQSNLVKLNMKLKQENEILKQQLSITEINKITGGSQPFESSIEFPETQSEISAQYYSSLLSISSHLKQSIQFSASKDAFSKTLSANNQSIISESINGIIWSISKSLENQLLSKQQLEALEKIALLCDLHWDDRIKEDIADNCVCFVDYLLEEIIGKPCTEDALEQVFNVISRIALCKNTSAALTNLLIARILHFGKMARKQCPDDPINPFDHSTLFYVLRLLEITVKCGSDSLSKEHKEIVMNKLNESVESLSEYLPLFITYVCDIKNFLEEKINTQFKQT